MTDQQETQAQLVDSKEQPAEQQVTPEKSPAEQLRDAMGVNFITHCVNARVAECEKAGESPVMVGGIDAISTVIEQVVNAGGPEGTEQQMNAVMSALNLLSVGGAPLVQHIVRYGVMQAARQGSAFAMLGELQGLAIESMTQQAMNNVYAACMEKVGGAGEAAPSPMKPFPAVERHEQHIEEEAAAAVAKAEAGDANYTSAKEAKAVMEKRKENVRRKPRHPRRR